VQAERKRKDFDWARIDLGDLRSAIEKNRVGEYLMELASHVVYEIEMILVSSKEESSAMDIDKKIERAMEHGKKQHCHG